MEISHKRNVVHRRNTRLMQKDIAVWLKRRESKGVVVRRDTSPHLLQTPLSPKNLLTTESTIQQPKRSVYTIENEHVRFSNLRI